MLTRLSGVIRETFYSLNGCGFTQPLSWWRLLPFEVTDEGNGLPCFNTLGS